MTRLNLAIIIIFSNISHRTNGRLAVRYTSIECETNKDYMSDIFCKLGINKDKLSTITVRVNCTRPLNNNMMINVEVKQKGNGYRNTFLNVTFKGCDLFGGNPSNPISKIIHNWMKTSIKTSLTCPIYAHLAVKYSNILCESNTDYLSDVQCKLGISIKKLSTLSIKMNVTRPLINKLMVNVEMKQGQNGFRNTFVNITFKGCEFLGGEPRNPVAKIIYNWIKPSLKTDARCPIYGPLILEDFVPNFGDFPSVIPDDNYLSYLKAYYLSPRVDLFLLKTNFQLFSKRN